MKLGLEIKRVTIVSDEKGIVKGDLKKINLNRKSKKEFEKESKEDKEKKASCEWFGILSYKTKIIGNDGVLKDEAVFFKMTQQRAYQFLERLKIKKIKLI